MPELIRTFIAVILPEPLKGHFSEVQQALKGHGLRMAWVSPGNVHLTLKFLGDIEQADIDPIAAVMNACAQRIMPLALSASGLGVFPDLRRPRVLWLGLSGDVPQLIALQHDLDAGLVDMGKGRFKPEDRPFKGHLTLGRIKSRLDPGILARALKQTGQVASQAFTVLDIHLIQSRLTPSGAIYTPLRHVMLGHSGVSGGICNSSFIDKEGT